MQLNLAKLKTKFPKTPGVYLMKSREGDILYVGKAGNLRRRVLSYWERPQEMRIAKMIGLVARVDFLKTDTVIEALILEARLIKKYQPFYNIKEKDDKSFMSVIVTRERFPRVLCARQNELSGFFKPRACFGPFTDAASLREAMRILRKIFPWNEHEEMKNELRITNKRRAGNRACFNYQIGLCPGVCAGTINLPEYKKTLRQLILFMSGKKKQLLLNLKREMRQLAKGLRFEDAEKTRRKLIALEHIQDVALIKEINFGPAYRTGRSGVSKDWERVEGYDISNISGVNAVGSMVVFTRGMPDKAEYRKFRIKTVLGANDVAMLGEVLKRRFSNAWKRPNAILVDGGIGQVNAARAVCAELNMDIPVIGISKGPRRKNNNFIYPPETHAQVFKNREMLIRVRNEAHRFAVAYHRQLREKIK